MQAQSSFNDLQDAFTDCLEDVRGSGVARSSARSILSVVPSGNHMVELIEEVFDFRQVVFAEKVKRCLKAFDHELGPTPRARTKALRELGQENERRLGETLLLLLDRSDSMEKPPIIGRIVAGLVSSGDDLEYSEAMSLCAVLDRVILDDLTVLKKIDKHGALDTSERVDCIQRLNAQGLCTAVDMNFPALEEDREKGMVHHEFSITNFGRTLLRYVDGE